MLAVAAPVNHPRDHGFRIHPSGLGSKGDNHAFPREHRIRGPHQHPTVREIEHLVRHQPEIPLADHLARQSRRSAGQAANGRTMSGHAKHLQTAIVGAAFAGGQVHALQRRCGATVYRSGAGSRHGAARHRTLVDALAAEKPGI